MTPEMLLGFLRKAWSKETGADPENWTKENPAWYQCGPTTLLGQYLYGGEILMGEAIIRHPECIHKGRVPHFWNRLPDGKEIDLSREQFPPWTRITEGRPINRLILLRTRGMEQKYNLLKEAVEKRIKAMVT